VARCARSWNSRPRYRVVVDARSPRLPLRRRCEREREKEGERERERGTLESSTRTSIEWNAGRRVLFRHLLGREQALLPYSSKGLLGRDDRGERSRCVTSGQARPLLTSLARYLTRTSTTLEGVPRDQTTADRSARSVCIRWIAWEDDEGEQGREGKESPGEKVEAHRVSLSLDPRICRPSGVFIARSVRSVSRAVLKTRGDPGSPWIAREKPYRYHRIRLRGVREGRAIMGFVNLGV